MREKTGNLFKQNCHAIVIPISGFVTEMREAVMGAGVAKQAAEKFKKLPKRLGAKLFEHGTHVMAISEPGGTWSKPVTDKYVIITLPTKPRWVRVNLNRSNVIEKYKKKYKPGKRIAGYKAKSDLQLIEDMLWELKELCDANKKWKKIVLPQIGCGAGELDWKKDVRPLMLKILDSDRYLVVK